MLGAWNLVLLPVTILRRESPSRSDLLTVADGAGMLTLNLRPVPELCRLQTTP